MIQKEIDSFLKCDLHLHSSTDYSRNYTKKDFIKKLSLVDLDVISITDHNIIDISLYNEIKNNNKIEKKIIGGCELNISLSDSEISKYKLKTTGNFFHGIIWFDIDDIDMMWNILKEYIKSHDEKIGNIENIDLTELSRKLANFSFKLDELQQCIKNINYYFIFHENKGNRNLSDYLDNSTIENQKYKDKLFYYNNNLAFDGSKRNKNVTSYFEKNLNTIVSSFLFSDSKTIDEIGKKFSWINFDGNFKNLILAISDPGVRVFRSDDYNDNPQKNNLNFLESVKFNIINKDSNNVVDNIELYFNPGLNGIIGSRGSGKTMLGNILGHSNLSNYKDFVDINSIQYKLKDSQYSKEAPKCKYLHQNTLLKIYENGDYMKLDFIGEYYKKILKEKETKIRDNISKIKMILTKEKELILNAINEYTQVCSSDFLGNKPNGEIALQSIEEFKFPNNHSEIITITKNINNIDESLDSLSEEIDAIVFTKKYPEGEEVYSIIEKYKADMKKILLELKERKEELIKRLEKHDYDSLLKRSLYLKSLAGIINEVNTKDNNQIKIYDDKFKKLMDYYLGIYKINKKILDDGEKVDKLYSELFESNISKKIKMENGEEITITTDIIKEKEYNEVLSEQFKSYISFNMMVTKIIIYSNDFNEVKKIFNGNKYKGINNISQYIEKLYKNLQEFFDTFLNINLKIEYKGKELSKYSSGKRSEILLEIFLQGESINSEEYKYIILDQPEDNLDTKTIIKELVAKIRKLKISKQLFIISHSAPIIVNGDSDLVIYSEDKNNHINYQSGRINDKKIRNYIVDTLDGGEKNLRMRLNKYDFNYEEEL